jgi:hypothetical protein
MYFESINHSSTVLGASIRGVNLKIAYHFISELLHSANTAGKEKVRW